MSVVAGTFAQNPGPSKYAVSSLYNGGTDIQQQVHCAEETERQMHPMNSDSSAIAWGLTLGRTGHVKKSRSP